MSRDIFESSLSALGPSLILAALACFLIGCVAAMKILKGSIHHSVPWVPWLLPITAWLAAAVGGYVIFL